jgi:hypothetical protein
MRPVNERKLRKVGNFLAAPFIVLCFAGVFGFRVPDVVLWVAFAIGAPAGVMALWLFRLKFLRVSDG